MFVEEEIRPDYAAQVEQKNRHQIEELHDAVDENDEITSLDRDLLLGQVPPPNQ